VMSILHERKALDYTVVVSETDNAPVAEQYVAPFTASAIGDFFARRGHDVLVVFDDMTKHAWAYRQVSLLLDRPPGREAYPGDIFYVHTQLMEHAGCFNENLGEGSMTFLAIAETQQGDLTGYIPSNFISMCDGQIVMSSAVFADGMRPAVDIPLSLSIVGGRAQPPILKDLALPMRADYANYLEISRLSRLASEISEDALAAVRRGEAIRAVFQQGHHELASMAEIILLLYALQNGYLDDLEKSVLDGFCHQIYGFVKEQSPALVRTINEHTEMTPDIEDGLERAVKEYFAHLEHDAGKIAGGAQL